MTEQIIEQPKPKRVGLIIWMIASQVLMVFSLLIWVTVAGLSVMAFDSGESPQAWAFVITVWSYPIIPFGLVIAAWIAFARRKNKTAAVLSGLSFLPPVIFFLCITVASFSSYFYFLTNNPFTP